MILPVEDSLHLERWRGCKNSRALREAVDAAAPSADPAAVASCSLLSFWFLVGNIQLANISPKKFTASNQQGIV